MMILLYFLLFFLFVLYVDTTTPTHKQHNINDHNHILQQQSSNLVDSIAGCITSLSPLVQFISKNDASSYDNAIVGTNFRFAYFYPLLIVNVTQEADIRASIVCAGRQATHIDLVVMNGGHSFEGDSCTSGGLMLHMDSYNRVTFVDHVRHTIKVQSGMRLGRLYGEVIRNFNNGEFVFGGGTCPTVGVVGHVLCGGYGLLGRKLGLASDQVLEFEVFNNLGTKITVNNASYQDLFWALRGGCSSSFGIVSQVTFNLFPHVLATNFSFTIFELSGISNVSHAAFWWQSWASSSSRCPPECSSVLNFGTSNTATLQMVCMATLTQALSWTLSDIFDAKLSGGGISYSKLKSAYAEKSYLETVLWWGGNSNLDELLAISSLPPLYSRSQSHRKAKSILATSPLPSRAFNSFASLMNERQLNQIEMKAYLVNSTSSSSSAILYTDTKSPLLRGMIFEMHFSNSFSTRSNATESKILDLKLVNQVNSVATNVIAPYFTSSSSSPLVSSYIGYIDHSLLRSSTCYFGVDNAKKMSSLRKLNDKKSLFETAASRYLF